MYCIIMKIIIFGAYGWIGSQFVELLQKTSHQYIIPDKSIRVDDDKSVTELLNIEKPSHVISFIGRTHGGNYSTIDYLELPGKLRENINDNLYCPMSLAFLCRQRNIHYSYLGTGCIFNSSDSQNSNYTEESTPDFFGSSYSIVKGFTDRLMHMMDNVLNIRIRMPITDEDHPRNFISKIVSYEKICSIPNSMTVLPELLPLVIKMMEQNKTGTINLTNPGTISHNEILQLYQKYVDPDFTWKNFTIEEQDKILLSKRSNNHLSTDLLQQWFPGVNPIHVAIENCLKNWKKKVVNKSLTLNEHKCVIITGGCGAIGSHVVNYLKEKYTETLFVNIDSHNYYPV
jgi:3,5-epimerase/4-reductase